MSTTKVPLSPSTSAEFAQNEASTLFRGSSLAVKMMSEFGYELSKQYIISVLGEPIRSIVEDPHISFEINPVKLSEKTQLAINQQSLVNHCQLVVDNITTSVDAAPQEFRSIFGMFFKEVSKSFGEKVGFGTSLGVLFLRFYCPAVVKPVDHGLIAEAPSRAKLADLIYVAKVLQNLANGQKFGSKEEYMESLNEFIENNTEKLKQFFRQFIQEPTAGETETVLNPSRDDVYQIITLSTIADGFIVMPTPLYRHQDIFSKKQPSPAVLSAANELRARVSESFAKLYQYVLTKPSDRNHVDLKLTEREIKAAEFLVLRKGLMEELYTNLDQELPQMDGSSFRGSRRRKAPPTQRVIGFLKILIAPDMLLTASICELIKFSEAASIVTNLIIIFGHYGLTSKLLQYFVVRELIITFKKWQRSRIDGTLKIAVMDYQLSSLVFVLRYFMFFKRWQRRLFNFENSTISFFKSNEAKDKSALPLVQIPIGSVTSVRPRDLADPDCRDVEITTSKGEILVIRIPDLEMHRKFIEILNRALADFLHNASPSSNTPFPSSQSTTSQLSIPTPTTPTTPTSQTSTLETTE